MKKTAYQAAALERLRDENKELQGELRAAEAELRRRDRMIEDGARAYDELKQRFEQYLFGYSERAEALEEAEREYRAAAAEAKAARDELRRACEAEIAMMREFIGKGA